MLSAAGLVAPAGSNCADIADMFPDVFADYVCTAFPNDDSGYDSLLVALIALAVALPVTLFLGSCFEIGARTPMHARTPLPAGHRPCSHTHPRLSARNSQRQ